MFDKVNLIAVELTIPKDDSRTCVFFKVAESYLPSNKLRSQPGRFYDRRKESKGGLPTGSQNTIFSVSRGAPVAVCAAEVAVVVVLKLPRVAELSNAWALEVLTETTEGESTTYSPYVGRA